MKKHLRLSAVVILIITVIVLFQWNKPHRSVHSEHGIEVAAADLFSKFRDDESKANGAYLNKVLVISGTISDVNVNADGQTVVTLHTGDDMFGINCTMEKPGSFNIGDSIIVKGICTGYLSDVVLVRCEIQPKP